MLKPEGDDIENDHSFMEQREENLIIKTDPRSGMRLDGMQFSRMGVILDLILRFVVDFDPLVIIPQVGHEVSSPLIIATIIQKLSWIK